MAAPALAFVVVTDTFERIRGVVEHLRAQTVAGQVELVIACPGRAALELPPDAAPELARVTVVERPLLPLAGSRAAAIHAATAELVYIGETHVYAEPAWAERLLAAHAAAPGATIVPLIANANPGRLLSCAALALDYGLWGSGEPGPIARMPGSNVVLRRQPLLELDGSLERCLQPERLAAFAGRQGGVVHATDARILHLNVAQPGAWIRERLLAGRLVGGWRAARWPYPRRIAYALAAPLIAAVLAGRVAHAARGRPALLALIACGAVLQALGEVVGYLAGGAEAAERRMAEYEISKARYAAAR
jgi:hypothetical protein